MAASTTGRMIGSISLVSAMLLSGCATMSGLPENVTGLWGGSHVGVEFHGGLADVQFDCAAGTIDNAVYPAKDGTFSAKGTYRTGSPGPIKVGQFFESQQAAYSGQIVKGSAKAPSSMTLSLVLEDGTRFGPFQLTEDAPPQLTPCRTRAANDRSEPEGRDGQQRS